MQQAEVQRVAHIGSWEWNVKTGEVIWSDEMAKIYGRDPAQFTPTFEDILESLPLEDREKASKTINRSLETGEPF